MYAEKVQIVLALRILSCLLIYVNLLARIISIYNSYYCIIAEYPQFFNAFRAENHYCLQKVTILKRVNDSVFIHSSFKQEESQVSLYAHPAL